MDEIVATSHILIMGKNYNHSTWPIILICWFFLSV